MDKNKLIQLVQSSSVSEELKKELTDLVEGEPVFGPETIKKVQAKLGEKADESMKNISDLMVENAANEFNEDLNKLDEEVGKFQIEINKKADEIDLQAIRSK